MQQLSRSAAARLSSNAVRATFLDFFCCEKDHRLIRSSPVLPYNDPTLAFCNAGMNQFKSVLLGNAVTLNKRVANSQKCVRVGGKHNDLAQVGTDGTHHTFFEMLGNWSFGDYFKKEACEMAWELLTGPYGLNPENLYVTYFGGDAQMGLAPDLETREIWRSIGIPDERILVGSTKDNFWEMGDVGPCGTCAEIHFLPNGAHRQNLLELWNLVFIEFKRCENGNLEKLSTKNVDTGMGFERLLAVLQGVSSNYDTDLFMPLFQAIARATGRREYGRLYGVEDSSGLDTAYRLVADHARMITVCLADGFYPDHEGKLRGIIRKTLTMCQKIFDADESLLADLSSVVADILGDAYPEIPRNLKRIHYMIRQEAEILYKLRKERLSKWETLCQEKPQLATLSVAECPNLLPAYKRLGETLRKNPQPDREELAGILKSLCETFGVPPHLAPQLTSVFGIELDESALEEQIAKSKLKSRKEVSEMVLAERRRALSTNILVELRLKGVPITDDRSKYDYLYNFEEESVFPRQSANIMAFIVDGELVDSLSPELLQTKDCGIILDRTNLYSPAGGQSADTGIILTGGGQLQIHEVVNTAGYIVHWTRPCCHSSGLKLNEQCLVKIDEDRRKSLMSNHTATHLLNTALRHKLTVVDQSSSRVHPNKLAFDFNVYKETLTNQDLKEIERSIQNVIRHGVPVKRKTISTDYLHRLDPLITLPGETYHHRNIHIIEIDSGYFFSREPCCGTHVVDTSHLKDFIITQFKSLSSGEKTIRAVTGQQAAEVRKNTAEVLKRFLETAKGVEDFLLKGDTDNKEKVEECNRRFTPILKYFAETELMSYLMKEDITRKIEELRERLKLTARRVLRSSMEEEMTEALSKNEFPFFVFDLQCASKIDYLPLAKASKMCPSLPSFIFAKGKEGYKARCCVPKAMATEEFTAQLWMAHVANVIGGRGNTPIGRDPKFLSNLKEQVLSEEELKKALRAAKDFVENYLSKNSNK